MATDFLGGACPVFDRDQEWSELTAFASDSGAEATLAVVSGRRILGLRSMPTLGRADL